MRTNRLSIAVLSLAATAVISYGCQKEPVPVAPDARLKEILPDTTYNTDLCIEMEDPVLLPGDTVVIGL